MYGTNNPRPGGIALGAVDSQVDRSNNKLSWINHIFSIVKKANSVSYLRKSCQSPNKEVFLIVYRAYVRPRPEYSFVIRLPNLKKTDYCWKEFSVKSPGGISPFPAFLWG